MESNNNEITLRDPFQKIFLFKINIHPKRRILSCPQVRNARNWIRGFSEIEMLIWLSLTTAILGGFFKIHKNFEYKHKKIAEEFIYEWNAI